MNGPTLAGDEPAHGQPAPTAHRAPGGHAVAGTGAAPGQAPPAAHHAGSEDAPVLDEPAHGRAASAARPEPGGHAALVRGEAVLGERVEAVLDAVPARDSETRPEALARAQRQRRRWATQVVVVDELARRACAERGLAPPPEVSPARVPPVSGTEVADLGSIVAVALAHSPAVRALLAALEAEQQVPERAARAYYDRNPDRFLTPGALRRGVDPYGVAGAGDFLPYAEVRDEVVRELRRAVGRQAFFDWLDRARAEVEYAPGHEHPGDPSHPDHEHRH